MDDNYMTFTEVEDGIDGLIRFILTHELDEPLPEGLQRTPARVVNAFVEMTAGYKYDEEAVSDLFRTFEGTDCSDQMVIQTGVPFTSLCEHHMLPFYGIAHIGYIPRTRVVGLSKFKRVLDAYAKRLQMQERLTRQVADALDKNLQPRGVIVVIEAEHLCMTIRGAQAPGTTTITSAVTGDFLDPLQGSRQEFMDLTRRQR